MANELTLRGPLLGYARLKSLLYTVEGLLPPVIEALVRRKRPRLPIDDVELFAASRSALEDLLKRDVNNIVDGLYPVEVLRPESLLRHILRLPQMFREGIEISRRRERRDAKDFDDRAEDLLRDLPEYYRRNFHFQGNGYLSEKSARLYDHQVEVLFAGAADAMRRLILPPLVHHFGARDGRGLKFLEIGSGSGSATRFVRMTFPKAHIVSYDLSGPYLRVAQDRLRKFDRHDFIEGNAESLPFLDSSFDAVYSVFLFHELPIEAREQVIRESMRVLSPGGFVGMVDSLQTGDAPELDTALVEFPREFHEPFYKHYISHRIEPLFSDAGAQELKTDTGFFSKVVTGRKRPKAKKRD